VVDGLANITAEFAEALFSFVTFLAASPTGGSMIVGAGIVPLLVQLLTIRVPSRLQIISKMSNLMDVTLYGYGNAFQSFCNHHGVDTLVSRIEVCFGDGSLDYLLLTLLSY
jgi:E3 ubiquitin-protein ligase HUWE1